MVLWIGLIVWQEGFDGMDPEGGEEKQQHCNVSSS